MKQQNEAKKDKKMKIVRNKIYEFNVITIDDVELRFQKFKGKKILIVNLPTACEFSPQYAELEQLYSKYKDNLEVVGFPAKIFGREDPATSEPLIKECAKKYGLTFPIAKNISEKGEEIHPVYKWLLDQDINEESDNQISYNFQKYLIDQFGKLVGLFSPGINPLDKKLIEAIEKDFYQQSHTLQGEH